MKKLLTCLKLLVLMFATSFSLQAQTGSLQATETGSDLTNPIATVIVGEITGNQPATSLLLTTNNSPTNNCLTGSEWYFYSIIIDAVTVEPEFCNVTDLDLSTLVADVGNVVLVSVQGQDDPADGFSDTITIDMTLTASWLGVETDILTYGLLDAGSEVSPAVIDDVNHTVVIEAANSVDETTSVNVFTLSPGATATIAGVDQESGVTANDFSSPITYTITAADGTVQDWEVTMNVSETASSEKDMLTFNIGGFDAVIGANTIDLDITNPYLGLDIVNLTPTFTSSDFSSVTIAGVDQESGVTSNDYTTTVVYTVTAEDGTTKDYIATITIADVCDTNITLPEGGGNYVNNLNESWIVAADNPGDVVTISFNSFGTESCCDHLYVYEGVDDTGTFLFELDGTSLPADISSQIGLFLNFTSDGSVTNIGFDLDITCAPPSSENDFISFTVPEGLTDGTIDTDNHTVDLEIAFGEDPSALTPSFEISEGSTIDIAGVDQVSGVTENPYIAPVTYTVTAQDGTTQDWIVTITVSASASDEKDFLTFSYDGFDGVIGAGTVDVTVSAFETDLTSLNPTFTSSPFSTVAVAGVDQVSGTTSNDFSAPVTYTVTAQDGTTQDYVVTFIVPSMCGETFAYDADILGNGVDETFFFVPDAGTAITLTFTAWGPDFNNWNDVVTIYDGPDTSAPVIGVFEAMEPNPGPLTSTSVDGTITIDVNLGSNNSQTFLTADVTCDPLSSENDFISFSLLEELDAATIDTDAHTVAIETAFGTDVTALTPIFESSVGSSVSIAGTPQESDVTTNNYSGPVTYTVTAQDGTTQDWVVSVSVAAGASDANDILTYTFDGFSGVIGAGTVDLTIDAFTTDISALNPEFTISPFSTIAIAGVDQVSGVTTNDFNTPVTYTITAQDGSTQDWVVTVIVPSMCGETFAYDADILGNGVDETFLFVPDANTAATLTFTAWGPDFNSWNDVVTIYDGPNTSSPVIGTYTGGEANPGPITSTAFGGEITIDVNLGSTNSQTFFTADITCTPGTSETDFVSFSIPGEETGAAVIDDVAHTITIEVGFATDLTTLAPTFTTSAGSAPHVGGVQQESGVSINDFTSTFTYDVISQDGTSQAWTVDVTNNLVASTEKDILTFSAAGVDGTIGANTVDISLDPFNNIGDITPLFTLSTYATATISGVEQESGVTSNDYSTSLTYTITAEDGSTKDYIVTITKEDICGFNLVFPEGGGNYANNENESWLITADTPGDIVTISFNAFATEGCCDHLFVYEGVDDTGTFLFELDGTALPADISAETSLFLNFTSDGSVTQTGFDLDVSCITPDNDFLTFTLADETGDATIDTDAHTIDIEVQLGTDPSALTPSFTVSPFATVDIAGVDQVSGTTENPYNGPVTYTVTASNGTSQDWIVTVSVADAQSQENDFLAFNVNGSDGVIDDVAHTVNVEISPLDPDLTSLTPTFTISPFATVAIAGVDQVSGTTANDFTTSITYTITAQDASTQDWTVTVTVGSICGQTLAYDADILGNGVDETFVFTPGAGEAVNVDFSAWGPDFNNWNDVVTIYDGPNTTSPVIGTFGGNEPNPGTIVSTSPEGSITIDVNLGSVNSQTFFTANITCTPALSGTDILSYTSNVALADAVIDDVNFTVDMEATFGTDVTALSNIFTLSPGASASVGGVDQVSGTTANDFTNPVVYTVTAQDGSTQDWTVTVNVALVASDAKEILTFSINGVDGVIGDGTITVALDAFADLSDLTPSFTISPFASVTVNGAPQVSGFFSHDFSTPVTYVVEAQDETTKDFVVTVTKEDVCGSNITFPQGGGSYANNEDETWVIIPDNAGEVVTISFNSFGTEGCCDHLFVYEGVDATGTFLFELDGTSLPADISSDIGLFLNFTSDGSVTNIGFDLDITCESSDASLNINVMLEGPYDDATGMMLTGLRDGSHIPLTDPYTGASTLAGTFFDEGNNLTVVDWVEIEIRQAATAAEATVETVVDRFNGLVLSNGDVVGEDGTSNIVLTGIDGDAFIVVNHRNHLSMMSATAVSAADGMYTYDFTTAVSQVYSDGAASVDGMAMMHQGDVNGDGTVKYVGASNDDIVIFNLIDGNTNLNNTDTGYNSADVNMDGVSKYVGANNDATLIFNKVDGNSNLNNTVTTTTP